MIDLRMTDEALARRMAEHRDALDAQIVRSGAASRVRDAVLVRRTIDPLAGLRWQRVAAAVLVAGMLGVAFDFVLPERPADSVEVAIVEALYGADQPEAR